MPRRIVPTVVLVCVLLGAATSAPAAGAQDDALLSREAALDALRAYEHENARNNAGLGVEGQGAVELPPIKLIDDATFRELRNRHQSLGPQGRVIERRVVVPRQTAYPLQFIAAERIRFDGGEAASQLLLFDRATANDDWKVSSAAQLGADTVPPFVVDAAGYAAPLDADHAAALKLAPEAVVAALADVWTRSDAGAPITSELFESGPLTTGAVSRLVDELAFTGIEGEVDFGFEPAPYPVVTYRLERGRALVMFALAIHETIRPADSGERLVQPKSRATFGGLVVPGRYSTVGYERLALLTAVVPRAGAPTRVRIVGSYSGLVSASTTP